MTKNSKISLLSAKGHCAASKNASRQFLTLVMLFLHRPKFRLAGPPKWSLQLTVIARAPRAAQPAQHRILLAAQGNFQGETGILYRIEIFLAFLCKMTIGEEVVAIKLLLVDGRSFMERVHQLPTILRSYPGVSCSQPAQTEEHSQNKTNNLTYCVGQRIFNSTKACFFKCINAIKS